MLATEEKALLALLPIKTNCADNKHQDYSQHHRVFRNVLALFVLPKLKAEVKHYTPSWLECFQFEGRADEKIRILTLKTSN